MNLSTCFSMTSVVSLTLLMAVSSNGLHYLDPDYYEAENIGQGNTWKTNIPSMTR